MARLRDPGAPIDIPRCDERYPPPEPAADVWRRLVAYEWELRRREQKAMQAAADAGRWLVEREWDELDSTLIGPALDTLMSDVIPRRAAARARARVVLDTLRNAGHHVEIRDCAARCEPDPDPDLAAAWDELRPFIENLLDEEQAAAHVGKIAPEFPLTHRPRLVG